MIKSELDGKFPGGESLSLTTKDNAVRLPDENPNLSEDINNKVKEIT